MTVQNAEKLTDALTALINTIEQRKSAEHGKSYTAGLLNAGAHGCARKFGEEAVELIIAATSNQKAQIAEEAADTLYHLFVLLAAAGVEPGDVGEILMRRRAKSGLEEKASRRNPEN